MSWGCRHTQYFFLSKLQLSSSCLNLLQIFSSGVYLNLECTLISTANFLWAAQTDYCVMERMCPRISSTSSMPRATICRPHTFHDTWNCMHAVSNHMELYASSEHVYVNAYNLLAFSLNYIQAFRGTSRNLSRPSESSIWERYLPLKWPFLQRPLQTSDCKWWQWIRGEILMCF